MGFFDVLKNVATGKPGFEAPSENSGSQPLQSSQTSDASSQPTRTGPKQIPLVRIEDTDSHTNGSNMRVEAVIQNDSHANIFIDRIFLLNTKVELDRELRPGESWRFTVYNGPRPNHRNYNDAKLEYRDATNDYFASLFTIDYNSQESDSTYTIKMFRPAGQQDIGG